MLNLIYSSSTSACFEFDNEKPYRNDEKYDVLINGERIKEGLCENVFSIFSLSAERE